MSRHRNVRNLDYGEEFDDIGGHSWSSSEPEPSPETRASYMYNYQPSAKPLTEWGAETGEPAKDESAWSNAPTDEGELLAAATAEVRNVLGENFSTEDVNRALHESGYNAEQAVAILLDARFDQYQPRAVDSANPESDKVEKGERSSLVDILDDNDDKSASDLGVDLSQAYAKKIAVNSESGQSLMFQFDTPSPDDLVLEKQMKSALRSSAPAFSKKPSRVEEQSVSSQLRNLKIQGAGKTISIGESPSRSQSIANSDQKKTSVLVSSQDSSRGQLEAASTQLIKQRAKRIILPESRSNELTVVVVGHVDAGKSTLVGYLLKHIAQVRVKKTRGEEDTLAWIADMDPVERERGVTIDTSMHHMNIPGSGRHVVLIDSPGHRDFVPAMIVGASQAGAALLIVDASPGEFEAGFSEAGQTREHGLLLRGLGITNIVVVVNKMDVVEFREERFLEIKASIGSFLKQAGVKGGIVYVPCAGISGHNVVEKVPGHHALNGWHKGPTLVEAMDGLAIPDFTDQQSLPTRVSVMDVSKQLNFGAVSATGVVLQGSVASGDRLLVQPMQEVCTVKAVRTQGDTVGQVAVAGQSVSIGLTGSGLEIDPSQMLTGTVLCDPERPLAIVRRFDGQLVTMPTLLRPLVHGSAAIVHVGSGSWAGRLLRIRKLLGKGVAGGVAPRCLVKNQSAEVELELAKGAPLAAYSELRPLGRFMLREKGRTLAAGIVTRVSLPGD